MLETEAHVTIKDHKDDFPNKISRRLINPSKSSNHQLSSVKNISKSIERHIISDWMVHR